ncbi:hypothetical protein BKP45_15760 [Anaerobacillus alkalidiazotrophicus]|uniref:Photosynthesis system II assembly factor Ycf48/Hcf136-like domain-containing protein n=1 Tax=Anaerobacillus alkalidiazotrophicus TaxID=472963 RepID=A0A1S2M1X3_9BACI|nr:sialidase family protein [Anaerobacillus alkalidiazotrophicus]OIJ18739.1 hypothetical protein BKP45_15760 [Anaerobacillus alkalidiazotrophicus]
MRISQCFSGATAVTKGLNGDYFLAVDKGILLIRKDGTEKTLIQLENRILDLTFIDSIIYGVGDNGTFIRSTDYGHTWDVSTLPTTGSMWSICSNKNGTVVTHGNTVLFLSLDFGNTWKTLHPFQGLIGSKPSIRSLFLEGPYVFVGTKVHRLHGGIWRVDLEHYETIRIKKDTRMIASILKHKQYIVSATGTCKGHKGTIEYCQATPTFSQTYEWETCESDCQEGCYLDLSESDGYLYTTTSQDEKGVGKVLRVYIDEKKVVPCAIVHGHGWRVSNQQSEFLVAGLYTSLYTNSQFQHFINH